MILTVIDVTFFHLFSYYDHKSGKYVPLIAISSRVLWKIQHLPDDLPSSYPDSCHHGQTGAEYQASAFMGKLREKNQTGKQRKQARRIIPEDCRYTWLLMLQQKLPIIICRYLIERQVHTPPTKVT